MCSFKLISTVANRTTLFGGTKFYFTPCSKVGLFLKTSNGYYPECNIYKGSRSFSVQSSIQSLIQTQSGIFKSISESAPVDFFKTCLVTVHDTSGLPWWATIICTTIALRTVITLPLAIYQNYILAKFENLHLEMPDIVKELKKETAVAVRMFDWDERTAKLHYNHALKKQWNALIVRDNCHPLKAGVLLLFQIPTWVCFSVSLRNMAYMLPVQDASAEITFLELSVGGFAWVPNLVAGDTTFILPLTLGLTNLAIIELQTLSKVRVPTKLQKVGTNIGRGISILMIPLAAVVPSCLALYWTTSSMYGLIQNMILLSPKVKRLCRIPKTASELEQPYSHVLAGFKHKMNILK